MAAVLPGDGYSIFALCFAQVILGVIKAIRVNFLVFLALGLAQLAAAAAIAYNTLSLALPALGSGGGDADLSSTSALLFFAAAATAAATAVVDFCVSFAYCVRGIPTEDARAGFKALTIFSLAGVVTILAGLTIRLSWDVASIQVVDVADGFADMPAIVALAGIGLVAAGVAFVTVMSLVNLCSAVGNRRFALTWFVMYFVTNLPAGVILGIAVLMGTKAEGDGVGTAAGLAYIAFTVFWPVMSLGFAISKESFVLEKYKNGDAEMAF